MVKRTYKWSEGRTNCDHCGNFDGSVSEITLYSHSKEHDLEISHTLCRKCRQKLLGALAEHEFMDRRVDKLCAYDDGVFDECIP